MDFNSLYTLQKQTHLVMEILCEENDEVTFVNYYLEAAQMIRQHYSARGITLTDANAYGLVCSAVRQMLEMLPDPKKFIETSTSRDIFATLRLVIEAGLRKG